MAAAAAGQLALAGHSWPNGAEVRVRMGLHTGEPAVGTERYTGIGVHRAARIGAVGHGGQMLVSNATRELVEDDLPEGLSLRDLGSYQLKDIDRPERLWQLVVDGQPSAFPPLTAPRVAQRRPLWQKLVAGALLLGLLATVSAIVLRGSGDEAPVVVPNSLVKIDTETNEIASVISVGREPTQVRTVGRYVFVASGEDKTLTRIDAVTGDVTTSGTTGADWGLASSGDRFLWVLSLSRAEVSWLDANSLLPIGRVPLAEDLNFAFGAVGGGSLWVSQFPSPAVSRYRLRTLRPQRRYTLQPSELPVGIAFGHGAAWVAFAGSQRLFRIDAGNGRTSVIPVGSNPSDPAIGFGSVWAAMTEDGTLWRVNGLSQTSEAIVPVGRVPFVVATGAGSVWVTNNCDGTVSRIDPEGDRVVETIETGLFPRWLVVGHGYVWVGIWGQPVFPGSCD